MRILSVLLLVHVFGAAATAQSSWSYSSYVGSAGGETVTGSGVDAAGNIYIAGTATSSSPTFTNGACALSSAGFVYKLNIRGQQVFKQVILGPGSVDAVHVDPSGNTYLAGRVSTQSCAVQQFQSVSSVFQRTGTLFVLKLGPDGTTVYSGLLGGAPTYALQILGAINTDANGNLLLCGNAVASTVPITPGAFLTASNPSLVSEFCMKVSSDGTRLLASTLIDTISSTAPPGPTISTVSAVSSDSQGNFIVAGSQRSPNFPLLNAFQTVDQRRSLFRRASDSTPWVSADNGSQLSITSIEVDGQHPQTVFLAGDAGIQRSVDGGASWTVMSSSNSPPRVFKVHPLNSNYQVRAISSQPEFTQDGGMTWHPIASLTVPLTQLPANDLIAPDATQEGAFFVLGTNFSASLVRFDAKAGTWKMLATGPPFAFVRQAADGVLFYGAGPNNPMFRIRNGVTTQIQTPSDYSGLQLAPSNPQVIYTVNPNAPENLWRSGDEGDSWQLQAYPCHQQTYFLPTSLLYVDPQSENTVYASCYVEGGVYRSMDGGQTWQSFDDGLLSGNIQVLRKGGDGTMWAGGPKTGNAFVMRISSDAKNLLSSSFLGGAGAATISAISEDNAGNLILGGYTGLSADFPETIMSASNKFASGFVMRLSGDASQILVSRRLNFTPAGIAQDSLGRLHLTGATDSNFVVTADAEQSTYRGNPADAFWAVISSDYSQIIHATFLGGAGSDNGTSVNILPDGRTVVAGNTLSLNFPVTVDAAQPVYPKTANEPFVTISSVFTDPNEAVVTVPAGGADDVVSSGLAPQVRAGYASASISGGPTPYGTAVFSLTENGVTVSEAGVPASGLMTSARLFIDFRNNVSAGSSGPVSVDTGIAMVNPGSATATISLRLLAVSGQVIAAGSGSLNGGSHLALFVNEMQSFAPDFMLPPDFPNSVRFASLEISSTQSISLVGLRLTVNQRGETLMTSTPVADLSLAPSTSTLVFPQFADGAGFTNTLILLNTSKATETGNIRFRNDTGVAVAMTLNGVRDSAFAYSIPAGGAVVFESDGSNTTVQTGWIEVAPTAGTNTPAGSGVYRLVENGVAITESAVSASQPGTHMRVYIDTANGHDTGIAFANPGNTDLTINLSTVSTDGVPVAGSQTSLTVPALGHTAKFIGEMVNWNPGLKGVVEISASGALAALTLRTLLNQRGDILLTSFPVADLDKPAPMPIFPQIADGGGFQTEIILISPGAVPVSATVQDTFN